MFQCIQTCCHQNILIPFCTVGMVSKKFLYTIGEKHTEFSRVIAEVVDLCLFSGTGVKTDMQKDKAERAGGATEGMSRTLSTSDYGFIYSLQKKNNPKPKTLIDVEVDF